MQNIELVYRRRSDHLSAHLGAFVVGQVFYRHGGVVYPDPRYHWVCALPGVRACTGVDTDEAGCMRALEECVTRWVEAAGLVQVVVGVDLAQAAGVRDGSVL